jgi:hypothetical protein
MYCGGIIFNGSLLPFCGTLMFFNILFSGGDFLLINLVSSYPLNSLFTYDDRQNLNHTSMS